MTPRQPALGMQINVIHSPADAYAGEIVRTALIRSFTSAQVAASAHDVERTCADCGVWINPVEDACESLAKLIFSGGKALVLGRIGPRVAELLGLKLCGKTELPEAWGHCPTDPNSHHDVSPASVTYIASHPLAQQSPLTNRPFCRFDFANEWNNLGFGRITLDGGAWSLQSAVRIGDATPLADWTTPGAQDLAYAAVRDTDAGAVLWFNRPVGPVDSLEWRVIEFFFGEYRSDNLPCLPYISEIPAGFAGAVNSRLDCDEAVGASRSLFELYHDRGLPLSLALLTGQSLTQDDTRFMRELIAAGGSVVSHSVHHYPHWGGSYELARGEAESSRAWFEQHLAEALPVHYAVSPFHQNPSYAVAALADAGYEGFVGGIVANDPEYLLGRAGRVPFAPRPLVSFSAQCMLHGDCYHRYHDSIDSYRESFDQHLSARGIFGYLDHPFSARYQYGWPDEATRLAAHCQLIDHIQRRSDIWWPNLVTLLDFLRKRDAALVEVSTSGTLVVKQGPTGALPPLAILWKGQQFAY